MPARAPTIPDVSAADLSRSKVKQAGRRLRRYYSLGVAERQALDFAQMQGKLLDEKHFGTDQEAALDAYAACELKHRDEPMIDIVLVGSDSIDTVRMTHANYFEGGFDGTVSVSKYLAGI